MEKTSLIILLQKRYQAIRYTLLARWLVIVLLLCFFGQTVLAGPHLSLTADEPVYMAQGYVYWKSNDFRMQLVQAQPPLPNLLAGAFLILQPGPQPELLSGWEDADLSQFSRAFAAWYGDALPAATFVSRLPMAWVALLGAAFVFRWAREYFGIQGGLLALTLFAFDPNLIAHSGLATTDMLLAVWSFVAVYAALRWLKKDARVWWGVLAGLALGLALGSKTSGSFALGIVGLLYAINALQHLWAHRRAPRAWGPIFGYWGGRLLLLSGLAALTLWALYRFELRPLPGTVVPVPLASHWTIMKALVQHMAGGHSAYLVGEISQTGWRSYYPVAFSIKTPLPTLLVFLGALGAGLMHARRQIWRTYALWLTPMLYAIMAIISTINIGYRYLLIMFPFLYVLCAGFISWGNQRRWRQIALCGALSALSLNTLCCFPHYLAYFNVLAGGSEGGYRYLVDSNLDWGQEFIALRDWLDANPVTDKFYLSYYTYVDPALYGIDYIPIAPAKGAAPILSQRFNPVPGLYALSATPLYGVMTALPDNYDWFRHREPIARPGYGIFIYDVPAKTPTPAWLGQCAVPATPLTADAISEGLGYTDLRLITFDCTQSWVYPAAGMTAGWYALHGDVLSVPNDFISARLAAAQLSYQQLHPGVLPPFSLYEQTVFTPIPDYPVQGIVHIDNLMFLGHSLPQGVQAHVGQNFPVYTYWRVLAPATEPLSLLLHAISADSAHAIVGDGLGFSVEQWQPGDIIIQRHLLEVSADTTPGFYTLSTGVYPLSTVQPWPILIDNVPRGDRLELGKIEVLP